MKEILVDLRKYDLCDEFDYRELLDILKEVK